MPKINEEQLISAIKQLKEIKPRKEWVLLAKSEIFEGAVKNRFKSARRPFSKGKMAGILDVISVFAGQKKLAYAAATLALMLVGIFGFAQYTVPGDFLFPVKKATEQSQTVLTRGNNLKNSVDNYNRRVQDLVKVVKEKREGNIPSAISEVKQSMAEAVKSLTAAVSQKSKDIKEIAIEVKKLEDNKKQLETLGIDISSGEEAEEFGNILSALVESEIKNLEEAILAEEQEAELEAIIELYNSKKFAEALEKILLINNIEE
ncbi:MAG: hypothetical protein HYT36_00090 [Candidatus Staskawiczbacteria bacterium]|nr:hypothetical protein [Candidatus Staskawiczbacteria bacterium]